MRAPHPRTHVINEGYFLRHEECKWLQSRSAESWELCEWGSSSPGCKVRKETDAWGKGRLGSWFTGDSALARLV